MSSKRIGFKVFLLTILFYPALSLSSPDVWDVIRQEFSLNHETAQPEVQTQIRWLLNHPGFLHKVCQQAEPYIYHIIVEIKKRHLPGELALLPMLESAFDPFAYSGAGAAGIWQLMPGTGSDLGLKQDWWVDGRRGISSSTKAALNYLTRLNQIFNGSWALALAAYDAGEGKIAQAIKKLGMQSTRLIYFWDLQVPRETQIYVPRFLALAEIIQNPERYNLSLPPIPYRPYFEEVSVGSQIDLNNAAQMAGISYKELIKLNPGYNRWTTAPYAPFRLLIPAQNVERFYLNLSHLPATKRVSWTKHLVRPGDNLDNIALRYHTTVNLLKKMNQLSSTQVQPNQSLLIPSPQNALARPQPQALQAQLSIPSRRRLIHIVQEQEDFKKIQRIYDVSLESIQAWNNLDPTQTLHTGQQLLIWKTTKQPIQYTIKPGDNLSLIAQLHKTKIQNLLRLNPSLNSNKALLAGKKIWVG